MTKKSELNDDPTLLAGLRGPDPAPGADVLLRSGEPLACLVCREQRFTRREIKLNTTGMTLMDLDWANRSGDGAVCKACGYVHVFLDGDLTWR